MTDEYQQYSLVLPVSNATGRLTVTHVSPIESEWIMIKWNKEIGVWELDKTLKLELYAEMDTL